MQKMKRLRLASKDPRGAAFSDDEETRLNNLYITVALYCCLMLVIVVFCAKLNKQLFCPDKNKLENLG
jgi:hypothetical protein